MKQQVIKLSFPTRGAHCIPIAASSIFCAGGLGAGFVLNQYSDSEMYRATMTPKIAASHVEFWKIMQTVTQSPPYRHQRVRVTYWSRFSFVRSAIGDGRRRREVREENRRLKVISDNLCKRNLIKAEKAAKTDKEWFCLMNTDACNMGQG